MHFFVAVFRKTEFFKDTDFIDRMLYKFSLSATFAHGPLAIS